MNIFFLDTNPTEAAKSLHNIHCVKMLLEACQLLSNVHHHCGDDFSNWEDYVFHRTDPYTKTHFNHPCSIWARSSFGNYEWLLTHGEAIAQEYNLRYNKVHKCHHVITYFMNNVNEVVHLPNLGLTKPALAMPDQYKQVGLSLESAVESYRAYYLGEKWQDTNGNRMDKWTYRNPPIWWTSPESRGLI